MIRVPRDLFNAALSVSGNSYAPYSNFHVAAAVRDERGRVFAGVNVENSSYGLTMCAERVAVFNAVTQGARGIREVLVLALDSDEPVPPCGACLQVLSEFGDDDTVVYMVSWKSGRIDVRRLGELLPSKFRLKGRSME
ncbi:MAG: cytidine deaminase [Desulfurococcales archaeon]|nr:cytidine deaminase [Desulfurococcales archaeon]MCE4626434.1 cytidine deaminase [Desulfurococcales archaeon]MCE4630017.1 cytidine deaminase [Desulfurococcales archaeon]